MPDPSTTQVPITRAENDAITPSSDLIATEEPLEIRLAFHSPRGLEIKPIAITMRTPTGPLTNANRTHDFELALGFLFSEAIIQNPNHVARVLSAGPESSPGLHNTVRVDLHPNVPVDLARLQRHVFTNSSCGICGKTTIDSIRPLCPAPIQNQIKIPAATLKSLPDALRKEQPIFDRTGGLHAAALFTPQGQLLTLREDVGRHNAFDKLVGHRFTQNALPASDTIALVSGRASYELAQKAIMAGIPILAAVGAPSSLAVDLAKEFHLTLIGFLRNDRFNIYTGAERITA